MSTPLNILLIEDSRDDAALLIDELQNAGFAPKWKRVESEKDYCASLKEPPEIILSDFSLPQFSTPRALMLLQESNLDIPFIIVSGTIGEERAVESLKAGATDYVLKGHLQRLGPAVRRALQEARHRAERRKAQDSLRLQTTALEAAANGILITDREGRIVFANPAFCAMTGYQLEEFLGSNPRFLKSDQHDDRFYRKLWETILAGKVWHGEVMNRRKDGTLYQEEMTVTPVRDGGGEITHFIAVKQDVTERKAMLQELWLRDQRLNSFFSNATAGLCILDLHLRFVQINETLATMNGLPAHAHLGKTFRELLPRLAPVVEPILQRVIKTGEPQLNVEISGATAVDGVRHWMASYFPVVNEHGKPTAIGAVIVEITETKRAQEGLRASEEKFRQLAENINEVFWMTNPAKDQMLYISPAYETIWGRPCESLYHAPRTWLEAIHDEDRDRIVQAAAAQQTSGKYDEVYRIRRPDGAIRWIHDRAFPIFNAAGEVYRIVGVAEDVTERKNLEEQFRQAQKMESIGQLAGGIAHDFNNILTVIQGHASLTLLDSSLSADAKESNEQISLAAERAAGLTRQLLTFSRRQVIQTREVNLNDVIEQVLKMLRRVLGADITLHFQRANLPPILADAGMLEQILMNLAVNARDAMPKGGTLTIRTHGETVHKAFAEQNPEASAGEFVCLEVSDTGCGIPPEHLQKIFEPFFTTKEVGKGTGLGLATVYGIVKQHRGWIALHSSVGKGTTFKIYFPAAAGRVEATRAVSAGEKIRGGKETILVVEDEAPLRHLVRNVLEAYGYTVIDADSGKAGLDEWQKHRARINLLLTDLVMPGGMTGRELADTLRAQDPRLKIIFTSGYGAEIVGQDFRLREGINFLQKPYAPRILAKCVRGCLDSSRVV